MPSPRAQLEDLLARALGDISPALRAQPVEGEARAAAVLILFGVLDGIPSSRLAVHVPSDLDVLTLREREVLALIAAGRSTPAIAQLLFLSPRTVDKHVENIRTKLGVRSRARAVAVFHASSGRAPSD